MKQLRLDQAIRNLTCGDLEIPLVLIELGVTGLKKTESCISWGFLGEGGRSGGVISCVRSATD